MAYKILEFKEKNQENKNLIKLKPSNIFKYLLYKEWEIKWNIFRESKLRPISSNLGLKDLNIKNIPFISSNLLKKIPNYLITDWSINCYQ